MTKQDMIDALGNAPRAIDAVFWYCQAWHRGNDDLYRIMCGLDYEPRPWSPTRTLPDRKTGLETPNQYYDPDLVRLLLKLDAAFPPALPPEFEPIKLADVKEGDILTAGPNFACIINGWPCRVFRHHSALGVACSGAVIAGVRVLPGTQPIFHQLTEDTKGYVVDFRR